MLACSPNEIATPQLSVIDSAGVRITTITAKPESLPVWTLEAEPRQVLTGTATGDETAFAFVGPVKFLSNGGLLIGDVASSRLMFYDARGRFVRYQWTILREEWLPVAILRLPSQTRLEDVRGDEVVVVRRDSLDVQTVAVHRLRR